MSDQPRVAKVLAALLASMTVGAIVLMALGNHPPSAGAFSLWQICHEIDSAKEAIRSQAPQSADRWNRVEVYYSGTKAGNIKQLASLSGLARKEDINCHFVICNGLGAGDGQIQSTEKWMRQWSLVSGRTWYGSGKTIRICVIADGKSAHPTESQKQMTRELVKELRRRFEIQTDSVHYPGNWR